MATLAGWHKIVIGLGCVMIAQAARAIIKNTKRTVKKKLGIEDPPAPPPRRASGKTRGAKDGTI